MDTHIHPISNSRKMVLYHYKSSIAAPPHSNTPSPSNGSQHVTSRSCMLLSNALRSTFVVILYSLLMTSLPVTFANSCPTPCQCRNDRQGRPIVVDCRNRGLKEVISNIPVEVVELDLTDNPIKEISRDSFPILPNLRRLSMENCLLETLNRMTFRNLEVLEILELSNNKIRSMDVSALLGLDGLREFRLSKNLIEKLPSFVFRGLALLSLDLSGNKISDLSGDVFEAAKIDWLSLNRNPLASIKSDTLRSLGDSLTTLSINNNLVKLSVASDAFDGLKRLTSVSLVSSGLTDAQFISKLSAEKVDLSGNQFETARFPRSSRLAGSCRDMTIDGAGLTELSENLASSMARVERLSLSNNSLKALDGELFSAMPSLRVLDLSLNSITRLPDDFSEHLHHLERLNLSRSGLKTLGHTNPFIGAGKLNLLDLSYNRIQTIPELGLRGILEGASYVNLTGNPLHCNCEVTWLRRWLIETAREIGSIKCFDPKNINNEDIVDRDPTSFRCSGPRIIDVTKSLNLDEGMDALLSCISQSDPASDIVWKSPFGEVFSITPPSDRTVTGTYAAWQISRIKPDQAGWYACTASNLQSSVVEYTYVHVVTAKQPPVEVRGLKYPDIPVPLSTTSSWKWDNNKSSLDTSTTGSNIIITTGALPPKFSDITELRPPPRSSDVRSEGSTVTAVAGQTGGSGDSSKNNVVVIVAVVMGILLLVAAVIFIVIFIKRRRLIHHNGRYSVKRKTEEELNGMDSLPYTVPPPRKLNPESLPLNGRT